jgi:hypothetical protein
LKDCAAKAVLWQRLQKREIIQEARRAAEQNNGILSKTDFTRITGIGQHHIYRLFPEGGWTEVKKFAEIERHPMHRAPLSDEELLEEYHKVTTKTGKIPTRFLFDKHSKASKGSLEKHFGGMRGALKRYHEWLKLNHPDSPFLKEIDIQSKHEIPIPPIVGHGSENVMPEWDKGSGTVYGSPISFRGLRHAPINEQGVVYLFGMVSFELGFIVEAVQTGFPDCEAKRCIDQKKGIWQRVLIEFEYKSGNFRDHGHDPSKCNVIVCWEHNWQECPIEVLELRSIIDRLDS